MSNLMKGSAVKNTCVVGAALAMSLLLALTAGCQRQAGPMEQAGKNADAAVEKMGQQVEKVGESIQDASKNNQKP